MRALPTVLSLLIAASTGALARAQSVSLPMQSPKYIEFSKELEHPSTVVVVGRLGKWKEGKRERLADGQLGGAGAVSVVSGTQFFKVPVTTTLQPRVTFQGKADKPTLQFEVQLARLPDGKEQRQVRTGNGASIGEDTLALFVLMQRPKQKGLDLVAVLPFDKEQHKGSDPEAAFVDAMRDVYTVNRRVFDLEHALAAVDGAREDAAKKAALQALKELVDKKPELKVPANDGWLSQYAGPLEVRAQKRLADAAPPVDAPPAGGTGK